MSQQQAIRGTHSFVLTGPWEDSHPKTFGHEPAGPSSLSCMEATFLSPHREAKHGGKCPLRHGRTLSSGSGNRRGSYTMTASEILTLSLQGNKHITGKVQSCPVDNPTHLPVLGLSKLGSWELSGTSKETQWSLRTA